ncbi:MAG: 30S ribosomal protein S6 [Candidatus Omnitrophota bacterium]|jgi:small subunit ribosomal protein S6
MNKYEAMVIVRPELSEEERKVVLTQLTDTITANTGVVAQAAVWAERRKLQFPIKKHAEGVYYLINFSADPASIDKLRAVYKLNENVLRVLITVQESK